MNLKKSLKINFLPNSLVSNIFMHSSIKVMTVLFPMCHKVCSMKWNNC